MKKNLTGKMIFFEKKEKGCYKTFFKASEILFLFCIR